MKWMIAIVCVVMCVSLVRGEATTRPATLPTDFRMVTLREDAPALVRLIWESNAAKRLSLIAEIEHNAEKLKAAIPLMMAARIVPKAPAEGEQRTAKNGQTFYVFPTVRDRDRTVAKAEKTVADASDAVKRCLEPLRVIPDDLNRMSDVQVGRVFSFEDVGLEIVQRTGDFEARVELWKGRGETYGAIAYRGDTNSDVIVKGIDMRGLVDGRIAKSSATLVVVSGTETYTTAFGGSRTVYVIEPVPVISKWLVPK